MTTATQTRRQTCQRTPAPGLGLTLSLLLALAAASTTAPATAAGPATTAARAGKAATTPTSSSAVDTETQQLLLAAQTAYARRDFATAAGLLQPLAEAGNAEASYHLSLMYYAGHGVSADPAHGFRLLQTAAAKGFPPAELGLYTAYYNGQGATADPAQALHWLQLAALHRLDEAQDLLGSLYYSGQSVPKDLSQAELWWLRAGTHGRLEAQRHLIMLYLQGGPGFSADMGKAMHWANIGMARWDGPTLFLVGALYDTGDKIPADPVKAWACFSAARLVGYRQADKPLARLNKTLTPEALKAAHTMFDSLQAQNPPPVILPAAAP